MIPCYDPEEEQHDHDEPWHGGAWTAEWIGTIAADLYTYDLARLPALPRLTDRRACYRPAMDWED